MSAIEKRILRRSDIDEEGRRIPALLRCSCGREMELWSSWANECDCGREYNGSGQLLAPRSEWGWETGEQGQWG